MRAIHSLRSMSGYRRWSEVVAVPATEVCLGSKDQETNGESYKREQPHDANCSTVLAG